MLIKVLCPCGTKFAFEVEPVHGRMPVRVHCPECSADNTDLANATIAGQLASPSPAASEPPKVRIRTAAPPAPAEAAEPASTAPAPGKPRIRLAGAPAAEVVAAPAPESHVELCPRHPAERAVEQCRVCGKPICLQCMELHGYVCSVFCRNKAEAAKMELPRYARQRSVVQQAARSKNRAIGLAAAAVLGLLFATWIWWTFFGTKPHVIHSVTIPKAERGTLYEMLSPTEVLVIKDRQLALLDIAKQKELWSTPLDTADRRANVDASLFGKPAPRKASAGPSPEAAAGKAAADAAKTVTRQPAETEEEEEDDEDDWYFGFFDKPRLLTANDGIWLKFQDRVACYDRATGARRHEMPLKQPLLSLTHNDAALVTVSGDPRGFRTVTLITLADGSTKAEQVVSASAPQFKRAAQPIQVDEDDENAIRLGPVELRDEFLPAGPGVAEFKALLLEHKTAQRQAMKPKSDKPLMESGRLSAGMSLDAAQELLNDMRRSDTGDTIQEDVSRYQVTVRRLLGAEAAPWTGEVIGGPPSFFPLKTVDVVFGAKDVVVLDKTNKKRWDAKLSFNMSRGLDLGVRDGGHFPCAETADALYVFDQGMLTCFELGSGQARWRLTSVGISRVQFDDRGKLYVNTTTASPDVIDFPKQINIFERARPVILKVDPATGKVLWKVENIADECILSGKFVYAGRSSSGAFGAGTHFNLYRLNPANGRQRWHYYRQHWPRNTGYHGNHFLLQWKDEVQVLRFLAF